MLGRVSKAARFLTTDVATIGGVFGASAMAGGVLAPVLPLYFASLGAQPAEIGFLFTAFALTFAIFEATWGWLSDRMAARTILSLRMLGAAGIVLLFTQRVSPWALYAIQLARGAIESAAWPVGRALVGSTISPQNRGTAMGFITAAVWGGMSVGALAGGILADLTGYDGVFLVSAGILLAGAVLVITRVGRRTAPVPSAEEKGLQEAPLVTAKALDRGEIYRRFAVLGTIAFIIFIGTGSQFAFVPLFGREVAGIGATDIGVLFLASGLASAVALPPLGHLSDRRGRKGFIVWGILISGAAIIGFAQATSFWWLLLFMVAGSLGRAMVTPAILALVSEISPLNIQGRMMGLYGACEDLGLVVGPTVTGVVWGIWGPRSAFWATGLMVVTGALAAVLLIKEREWRLKAIPTPAPEEEITQGTENLEPG